MVDVMTLRGRAKRPQCDELMGEHDLLTVVEGGVGILRLLLPEQSAEKTPEGERSLLRWWTGFDVPLESLFWWRSLSTSSDR